MKCASCGHENAADARFCGNCGTELEATVDCPACGTSNPAGQRFCNACGSELAPAAEPSPPSAPLSSVEQTPLERAPAPPDHLANKIRAGAAAIEGERKQVTVLFADVMGSMDLAEQCDPEEWRQIMDRFFGILCGGVHLFEGTVDKFTGDGVMALFGAPVAHEDHAQRACFAALHLIDDLSEFTADLRRTRGLNFLVRIGLNSGEVVVGGIGDDLGMEYTAVGHTVGLAQRMEQLAEPGKAYLTEYTGALVQGYLALSDLGEFEVKGSSRPLRVFELTGVGSARGRLDISEARGFTRFVGRGDEMKILEDAFEKAKAGEARVIGIVGEPGVGKSRLCHEFTQRWRAKGIPVYHTSGLAHARSVPLIPVMHLMRSYFDITDQDSEKRARERIAGKLLLLDETLVEDLPLIFDFLAIPDPERPAPRMDPDSRHRQLLDVVKRLIRAQSGQEPGINLYEDLHWIDPASEVFLANHVDAVQGTKSLTIVNFRPEYRADWMSKPYYSQIALVPLGPEAVAEMLDDMLGTDPSLAELPEMLRERTGGNPFFLEEVVLSLVEAGNLEGERGSYRLARPVEESVVPASVQVILSARMDRLDAREKAVLQSASVIGKEFPQSILARVADLGEADLGDVLSGLVAAGFIYEQEIYPESIYTFKHPLTQEVAYGSQLGDRRAATHSAVARAIAEQNPERLDERASLLADHWEAAEEALEAARWNARAAAWTGTRDPTESHRRWQKVRDLTDGLPASEETAALGLAARFFLLQYGWRLGTTHEEAERLFTQAEGIARRSGDLKSRALLLAVYSAQRGINEGDAAAMAELASQAIALAEESGDPDLYLAVAGASYGFFLAGEQRRAVETVERAMELVGHDPDAGSAFDSVQCPYGWCVVFKGGYLTNLGELDEARELIERGIAICRDKGDIETVGWGHMWLFWRAYYAGEGDLAVASAQQAVEIGERLGDAFSRNWSLAMLGAALLLKGSWDQAIELLENSRETAERQRISIDAAGWVSCWLGEAYVGRGDPEKGLELIREAIEATHRHGHPYAEVHARVTLARSLLALHGSKAGEPVERELDAATDLVRKMGSKSIEPLVLAERARLAELNGDAEGHERALREAHDLFVRIGASGHAERLGAALAEASGERIP